MHTDEYEISLERELTVCKKMIQRINKTLELLEKKHNKQTAAFIAERKNGTLQANAVFEDDFQAWESSYDSLQRWQELEKQYQEIYRTMKR